MICDTDLKICRKDPASSDHLFLHSSRPQVMHRVGASNRSLLNDPWSAPTVARTDAWDFWGQERQERCQCLELMGVMCFRVPAPRVVDLVSPGYV